MLFARYMKETWRSKTVLGAAVWFRIHQVMMTLTFLLTLIGFIVISSEKGFLAYTPEFIAENPHPVIGFVVLILALIQPIMAAMRPAPDSEKRWIFNWAHWFVANAAFILCKSVF